MDAITVMKGILLASYVLTDAETDADHKYSRTHFLSVSVADLLYC